MDESAVLGIRWKDTRRSIFEALDDGLYMLAQAPGSLAQGPRTVLPDPLIPTIRVRGA